VPYDRPNLSKDYLAGTAPEDWIPLRSREFYADRKIELMLRTRVTSIDPKNKRAIAEDGKAYPYDALLLATGADPIKLSIPGAELSHVYTLRTLADSRAIIAQAQEGRRAVIMGASFIGLEVAAALRARKVDVAVVAPDSVPMERSLGPALGGFIRKLHEDHGVVFHLGQTARSIEKATVTLANGKALPADFVVVGVGVRPAVSLASAAGLSVDNGVLVNELLQTSVPDIFAAGDIARWPDPHSGERIRVEHWVVAERQGQTAARNILGLKERFDAVPFFWSGHYDVTISYVGHASRWDQIQLSGSLEALDCKAEFVHGGRVVAVATIGRDRESLEAEVVLERS
jgi:NADPH-dependent 2,4-dienoyl-CoA reductase/sulfur reductase-like enzyme